jgi:endonuclease YncB( thermonuclease family)
VRAPGRPALLAGLALVVLGGVVCRPATGDGTLQGRVVGISDGDTITVLSGNAAVRIRLWGIDCPEGSQPFGKAAKRRASDLCYGREVSVRTVDVDRYKRVVGEVLLPDGRSVNREMVRAGLAWWYYAYAKKDLELAALEREAKAARRGLWADPDPVPPWAWRKGVRRTREPERERERWP